ncbi:MAG: uroporphyrinogen decarboxylase [Chlorobi bacterium]|nr:uroporphyrinogen decarboxylase [Chlorobiota bacterium]
MDSVLLNTINGKYSDRPPVWYMRQAGRVLPSYMKLREKYTFRQMMNDPELAADVTLLPVYDLGTDAAILFSDILVIPDAMGMGLEFTDKGPVFNKPLKDSNNPLAELNPDPDKLNYIYDAIDAIIRKRPENTPLIGFCGGPLTVLVYMIQGLSTNHSFPDAVKFIYQNKKDTLKIIEIITELSVEYLKKQAEHKADVFQLFETHAGLIPSDLYKEMFLPSVKKLYKTAADLHLPFIFFPKGFGTALSTITPEHCDYAGIDWQTDIFYARKILNPEIGIQGNLDPRLLFADKKVISDKIESYIDFGKENKNWIFNLGHGFIPGIPFENALFLTEKIKNTDWKRN